jgi:hypothetical protein
MYSLWKEEDESLQWLDTKEPKSVLYVNFGSVIVIASEQLVEFAMGLANSNHYFFADVLSNQQLDEFTCYTSRFGHWQLSNLAS